MPLFAIFGLVFLFSMLLVANALQMLSLVLWPFSKPAFRLVNCSIAFCWWRLCSFWAEQVHGIRPVITGDPIPEGENALLIANHQEMTDIVVLFSLAWRKKRLANLKWFAKDAIKYVPGVGWGMLFLDCLYVKRNWDADEQKIRRTFQKFLRERIPLWLVTFPEGTRLTPTKLAKARDFAQNSGLALPERVLVPRTRGFAASVTGLREHLQAVYDVTIAYSGRPPNMWRLFNQRGGTFNLHVRRYPIGSLPTDNESLARWLQERFAEKDRLLGAFESDGRFTG